MKEEELELAAEAIADEAGAGFERVLSAKVIAEMRRKIIFDLLAADRGELRRAMPDPVVERSGDLDEEADDDAKAGGRGA